MADTWNHIYMLWIDAGCPTDIPEAELALMRLISITERDGWREHERRAHARELLDAAETLVRMLTSIGCRLSLGADGMPLIGGQRELYAPYLPELRALRDPIASVLARNLGQSTSHG